LKDQTLSNKNYFIGTGNTDSERLRIINNVYNPVTFQFLKESGLSSNKNVLEIGCGYGHTAILIAQQILPNGKVTAVDYSNDTLEIARDNAKKAGISNIDFISMDINNLGLLDQTFDFIFGRWVLEFCAPVKEHITNIYKLLKSHGVFVYEALNLINSGHFSVPKSYVVQKWCNTFIKIGEIYNSELALADSIYFMLKDTGFKDIYARRHQPILTTPEEKTLFRLAIINSKANLLKNKVFIESELNKYIDELKSFENNNNIISGFFNNTLIRGFR
jgi:ubiquinone/menaquinone biosynthesis C-methylase UbiE